MSKHFIPDTPKMVAIRAQLATVIGDAVKDKEITVEQSVITLLHVSAAAIHSFAASLEDDLPGDHLQSITTWALDNLLHSVGKIGADDKEWQ